MSTSMVRAHDCPALPSSLTFRCPIRSCHAQIDATRTAGTEEQLGRHTQSLSPVAAKVQRIGIDPWYIRLGIVLLDVFFSLFCDVDA